MTRSGSGLLPLVARSGGSLRRKIITAIGPKADTLALARSVSHGDLPFLLGLDLLLLGDGLPSRVIVDRLQDRAEVICCGAVGQLVETGSHLGQLFA